MIKHTTASPAPRFLNRPLALLPSYRTLVLYPDDTGRQASSGQRAGVVGSIAVIPVSGCLIHGASYGFRGMAETSYGAIRSAFVAALNADSVSGIALHIDSPGGEVAGCFDLADVIYAARGTKPIWAICDEMACSAAYALASAADRILVPRTGLVGSIGVIAFHTDITRALDDAGLKVTTLQFGARKSDGMPTTPITSAARQRMQAEVDSMGELFVATVARNRGLKARDVRATEAGTFLGSDALSAGLADAVASPDEAFLALMDAVTERPSARSAARAGQRRDTPKAIKKKVQTMAAPYDFTRLRPAAERQAPVKRKAKKDGEPAPAPAASPARSAAPQFTSVDQVANFILNAGRGAKR